MSEKLVQNQILDGCSDIAVLFRTNAGTSYQGKLDYLNNTRVLIGPRPIKNLPKGYSDLSGVRLSDGKAVFIEVKRPGQKPKPHQEHFIKTMQGYNAIAGVATSVEEARRIINVNKF